MIKEKLASRFNKDGLVQVVCDTGRSQLLNKEIALERLMELLATSLKKPIPRKATKVSKQAKAARLASKKLNAQKKESRKKNFDV